MNKVSRRKGKSGRTKGSPRNRADKKKQSWVAAGYVSPQVVEASFCASLVSQAVDESRLKSVISNGGARINNARNDMIRSFLDLPKRFEWFWFLDADMILPQNALTTLLHTAETNDLKIVGSLAYIYKPKDDPPFLASMIHKATPEFMATLTPEEQEMNDTYIVNKPPPIDVLISVHATGFFCTLVHRSIFEAVGEKYKAFNFPWIDEQDQGPDPTKGPDLQFFERVFAVTGHSPVIDTSVRLTHIKPLMVTHEMAEYTYRQMHPEAYDE